MKVVIEGEFIDRVDASNVLHAIANLIKLDLNEGGFRHKDDNHIEWRLEE